jgi:hypothetical protein
MSAPAHDSKVEEACQLVEGMCAPSVMSAAEAVDFLEDVIAQLEQVCDALRTTLEEGKR